MTGKSKKHAKHTPAAKSAPWKVFEFAMGPGLMLAVLIALGAHLIISARTDELRFYTTHQRPSDADHASQPD